MTADVVNRLNIKFLLIGLGLAILLALFPYHIEASTLTKTEQDQFEQQRQAEIQRVAQEAYQQALIARAKALVGKKGGQCLTFARQFSGMARSQGVGMAKNIRTNSQVPAVGAVVKTNESRYGHVAVVLQITEKQIQVVDSNYGWNQRVGIHWMNINSAKIAGYVIL